MPKGIKGFQKGHTTNIGRKQSEETKRKRGKANSISLKGYKQTEEHKRNVSNSLKGKRPKNLDFLIKRSKSKEYRKKLSESSKGEKNYFWIDGRTTKNQKIRGGLEFRLWRELVFERDDWTCQNCLARSGNGKAIYLHPHHIKNFSDNDKLRFNIDNGITLCRDCHYRFHKLYDFRNNTREQIEEFLTQPIKK